MAARLDTPILTRLDQAQRLADLDVVSWQKSPVAKLFQGAKLCMSPQCVLQVVHQAGAWAIKSVRVQFRRSLLGGWRAARECAWTQARMLSLPLAVSSAATLVALAFQPLSKSLLCGGVAAVLIWVSPWIQRCLAGLAFFRSPALALMSAQRSSGVTFWGGGCIIFGCHALGAALLSSVAGHDTAWLLASLPFVSIDILRQLNAAGEFALLESRSTEMARLMTMESDPSIDALLHNLATHSPASNIIHTDTWGRVVEAFYAAKVEGQSVTGDEFIPPLVKVDDHGVPVGLIADGDVLINFDFRQDRARVLTAAFLGINHEGQVGGLSVEAATHRPQLDQYVSMSHYDDRFTAPEVPEEQRPKEAFNPAAPVNDTYGEVIGLQGIRHLIVAERLKGAAVMSFLMGRKAVGFELVGHKHLNDVNVEIFSQQALHTTVAIPESMASTSQIDTPAMRAPEVAAMIRQGMEEGVPQITANFANADMIAHSIVNESQFGNVAQGVLALDGVIGPLVTDAVAQGYTIVLTADHGNAEEMFLKNGAVSGSHTTNPVPFIMLGLKAQERQAIRLRQDATISDIAPTLMQLRGLQPPASWDRHSIITGNVQADPHRKILFIVLDGYGLRDATEGNAMAAAAVLKGAPLNVDRWMRGEDHALSVAAEASGDKNGYPAGEPGSTEFGHVLFFAGQTIGSDRVMIDLAIAKGEFPQNPVLLGAIEAVKQSGQNLHLMGIVSDGGVHSSWEHLVALLELLHAHGLRKNQVKIHVITDGRDRPSGTALTYLAWLEQKITELDDVADIVSLWGRGWGKDRRNAWYRLIEPAFLSLTTGTAALHLQFPDSVTETL